MPEDWRPAFVDARFSQAEQTTWEYLVDQEGYTPDEATEELLERRKDG